MPGHKPLKLNSEGQRHRPWDSALHRAGRKRACPRSMAEPNQGSMELEPPIPGGLQADRSLNCLPWALGPGAVLLAMPGFQRAAALPTSQQNAKEALED